MEDTQTKEEVHTDAPQSEKVEQSAEADLKKVAERAKAATEGFEFGKLFTGRLDANNYMYGAIGSFAVGMLLSYIPIIGWILALALVVIGFGATMRRLRDVDQESLLAIVLIVPFVNLVMVIYLCWKIGDAGKNRFGDAPDKNRELFRAMLNT